MKTKIILIAALLFFGTESYSQSGPPGTGGTPKSEGGAGKSAGAPIGGNILYLLAMGAVYGFYKVRGHLKQEND